MVNELNPASQRLRVVLASSESVPFSKTGGLADVVGALARTLDQRGNDVVLILPDYYVLRQSHPEQLPQISESGLKITIPIYDRPVTGFVNWTVLPESNVRVLLLRQPEYFDRRQLYQEHGQGYSDNCERFCFFSRAVLEICRLMVLRPDVIHCNDWQTGLIPGLLSVRYADQPGFENTASVMTLHNMAYQGRFWHFDMLLTGMDWRYFNYRQMESWGDLNLLKTGIAFADQITTVSPTYAREICTEQGGYGLEGLLKHRQADLAGILNGIDDSVWNPHTDPLIPSRYTFDSLDEGKADCKAVLQQRMGLPASPQTPVFGMVSRMTDQKGFDLIMNSAERLLSQDIQMIFLGTGDPAYEKEITSLAERYPDAVACLIGFDDGLAHQIEAGADAFLMPSRFEPCGLNQMYSLRYGTVPIVRNIGGLADSVIDLDAPGSVSRATGFVFSDYDADIFARTVERAINTFRQQPGVWRQIVGNGMARDWSWSRSAGEYESVYRKAQESIPKRAAEGRV